MRWLSLAGESNQIHIILERQDLKEDKEKSIIIFNERKIIIIKAMGLKRAKILFLVSFFGVY